MAEDLPPTDPSKFAEALAWFQDRIIVTDAEYARLSDEEKERAFKVAAVAQADVVTDVLDALEKAVSEGTGIAEFKEAVAEKLEQSWGGEQPGRLETIFRTNVQSAYGHGRIEQMTDPTVLRRRPAWRFDAIMDSRVSDVCESLNGTIRSADDGFWDDHQPPLHFNCRSTIVPLSLDEAADEGYDAVPKEEADEGFGERAAADQWEPDLNAYPDEIRAILEERLK